MMRLTRVLVAVLIGLILTASSAAHAQSDSTGKRYALVIGNADYTDKFHLPKLNNSLNDAAGMERALTAAGFQVTVVKNATRRDLNRAVETFSEQIARDPNSVGLFYYAGHGAQDNGLNYLIPVDAKVEYASDLETDGFDVRHVLEAMKEAHNQMNIVILDACRDNDLPRKRGGLRGLAKLDAPSGTFVAYAAAPGQGAYDGNEGANGVFTGELLKAMQLPGVPLEQMFKKVIAGVKAQTHGAQEPWSEASIQGEFFFIDVPKGSSVTVTPPGAPPLTQDAELLFWQSISSSSNPADYQAYLEQYPKGRFASLAKVRARPQQAALPLPLPAPTPAPSNASSAFPGLKNVVSYPDKSPCFKDNSGCDYEFQSGRKFKVTTYFRQVQDVFKATDEAETEQELKFDWSGIWDTWEGSGPVRFGSSITFGQYDFSGAKPDSLVIISAREGSAPTMCGVNIYNLQGNKWILSGVLKIDHVNAAECKVEFKLNKVNIPLNLHGFNGQLTYQNGRFEDTGDH